MIQMTILPVFGIVIADVSSAGSVFHSQFPLHLGLCQSRVAAEQTRQPLAAWRGDEYMESFFMLLENALASPLRNHTVANRCRLFNVSAGQIGRHFGIKVGDGASDVTPSDPETARTPLPADRTKRRGVHRISPKPGDQSWRFLRFFPPDSGRAVSIPGSWPTTGRLVPPASILTKYGQDAEHGDSVKAVVSG